MQKGKKESLTPGAPVRPLLLIAGLAVCFSVAVVLYPCFAERTVTPPAVRIPGGVPREETVQVVGLRISYLPNLATTRLSDMGWSAYRSGSWMRILIQFATEPRWADSVRFDCYVLLRDARQRTMLTGSVTCTYVEAGSRHLTSLFVPPNVMERYGSTVEAVAVECYYQNSLVSDYTSPRTPRKWWQESAETPVTTVSDTMVTWFYTPFSREGIESFEQVMPGGRGF